MTNSIDLDETARNEPSHLDLHCLDRYLFWFTWLKGLRVFLFQMSIKFFPLRVSLFEWRTNGFLNSIPNRNNELSLFFKTSTT